MITKLNNPKSLKDIFDAWPARAALAADIGVAATLPNKWVERNGVPARYWWWIVRAAAVRHYKEVTCDSLAEALAGPSPPPTRRTSPRSARR